MFLTFKREVGMGGGALQSTPPLPPPNPSVRAMGRGAVLVIAVLLFCGTVEADDLRGTDPLRA